MKSKKNKQSIASSKKLALRYVRQGWSVVPMHTVIDGKCSCSRGDECPRKGKHPRTLNGVHDATTRGDLVKKCWRQWANANIGIAAGEDSGVIVLDIDPRNGGDDTFDRCVAELGALPETVSADTGGGGRHLFFKHPAIRVRNDSQGKLLGAGIDVLSDGKIAIVAPSRHASGKRYAWQAGKEPGNIAIAQLPTPWLKRLTGNARHEQPTATSSTSEQQITEGGRNKHLISVAGALQRIGASRKAISAALKAENLTKCSPPPRRV
jgi:putative DNA primase/helicase